MDRKTPFPGKRSFIPNDDSVDDELGRSLKRIRLDSCDGVSGRTGNNRSPATTRTMPAETPMSPGELCVQRDLRDSLANGQLLSSSQVGVFVFRHGGTLSRVTSNRFLFSFASRLGGPDTTVSLTIPKRYPHQPPLLTIVSTATALEQQAMVDLIAVSPTLQTAHSVLWSPVHRFSDVLDWILRFSSTPTEPYIEQPKRLVHPSLAQR